MAKGDVTLPGRQQSRLTLLVAEGGPGCTKDMDCKGDRICTAGSCLSPAPSSAPLPGPVTSGSGVQRLVFLQQQMEILELSRPSMAWPIFLTIFGGLGTAVSVGLIATVPYYLAIVLVTGGLSLIPLAIGIVFWVINGARNRAIDTSLSRLRDERAALGMSSAVHAPPQMLELAQF